MVSLRDLRYHVIEQEKHEFIVITFAGSICFVDRISLRQKRNWTAIGFHSGIAIGGAASITMQIGSQKVPEGIAGRFFTGGCAAFPQQCVPLFTAAWQNSLI
jgi:hypothetical protein